MLLQFILYTVSLCLVSFYDPRLDIEKKLSSILIICMSISSITFMLCFLFYVWTLKYDLHFVRLTLQILPDKEYFIDLNSDKHGQDL